MRAFGQTTPFLIVGALLIAAIAPARAQTTTSTSTSTTVVNASTSTSTSTSSTTSTVPQALRCKNRLLSRATKLVRRLSRCDVKVRKRTAKERPFDAAACTDRAFDSYERSTTESSRFRRGCIECTLDGIPLARALATDLQDDLDGRIGCAPEVPLAERLKCETKLLKASSKLFGRLLRCRKEAALLAYEGGLPDEEGCRADARTRYDATMKKLACPACVDAGRIGDVVNEASTDVVGTAHCPCVFGDPDACPECQTCDAVDPEGCVPADEGRACGRNGCVPEVCASGECTTGDPVSCTDGDVCTVDRCDDVEDDSCQGTACCIHEALCDPTTLDPCVIECTCDPAVGCSCRCEAGCAYSSCVIFDDP